MTDPKGTWRVRLFIGGRQCIEVTMKDGSAKIISMKYKVSPRTERFLSDLARWRGKDWYSRRYQQAYRIDREDIVPRVLKDYPELTSMYAIAAMEVE